MSDLIDYVASGDIRSSRRIIRLLQGVAKRFGKRGERAGLRIVSALAHQDVTPEGLVWRRWAEKVARAILNAKRRQAVDPWSRKFSTIAQSLLLRTKDRRAKQPITRPRYTTATWDDCIGRLQQNVCHNVWRGRTDPWVRWTDTVAKNINRRWEGRYASSVVAHDQGERTEGDAGDAELPLRLYGAGIDA